MFTNHFKYIKHAMSSPISNILSAFGLPPAETAELLQAHSGAIAGSAALSALTSKFEPDDIDIWVYSDYYRNGPPPQRHIDALKSFKDFLELHGYEDITAITPQAITAAYYAKQRENNKAYKIGPLSRMTSHIQWFYSHARQKSIQVIHTFAPVSEVVKQFDLSICATWWDGINIHSLHMSSTLSGFMFRLRDPKNQKELHERLDKYKARGFILQDF